MEVRKYVYIYYRRNVTLNCNKRGLLEFGSLWIEAPVLRQTQDNETLNHPFGFKFCKTVNCKTTI